MTDQLAFFIAFLKNPLQVGSVIPSSHYLLRRIVDSAAIESATTIVELGPGNGGSTRAILNAAPAHATLLSVEVNPQLHELTCRINDKRLISHQGDARHLRDLLCRYGLGAPDAVVSGIPFSTMSIQSGTQLLEEIFAVLAPGGRFVAYQVTKRVAMLARPLMGEAHMDLELLNIPPMRVYRWEKR